MTASAPLGGGAGGGFLLSACATNSAVSVSAVPLRTAAASKCRSASSTSTSIATCGRSTSTILSMMAGASTRSSSGTSSSIARGRSARHLCRRVSSDSTSMGPSPSPTSVSALFSSSASRSVARIRPRSYGTTPVARQPLPKQHPGGQKRSQSTIIGVPGGPPAAGAANAGRVRAGVLGGGSAQQQQAARAQVTWREIFQILRERCNVFLLKPRRLVSRKFFQLMYCSSRMYLFIYLSRADPLLIFRLSLPTHTNSPFPDGSHPGITPSPFRNASDIPPSSLSPHRMPPTISSPSVPSPSSDRRLCWPLPTSIPTGRSFGSRSSGTSCSLPSTPIASASSCTSSTWLI